MSEDESAGEGPEDECDGKRERERHFCRFLANNRMTVPQMYSSAFHTPMYFIILDLVCNLPNFMLMKKMCQIC